MPDGRGRLIKEKADPFPRPRDATRTPAARDCRRTRCHEQSAGQELDIVLLEGTAAHAYGVDDGRQLINRVNRAIGG
jgi:hypothetical protein